jgi:hypothetical protein
VDQSKERRPLTGRRTALTGALALAAVSLAALAGCRGPAAALPGPGHAPSASSSASRSPASRSPGRGVTALAHVAREGRAASTGGGPSGVTGGALFGGNYPVVRLEKSLGRKLAIVRLYYFIGSAFPGSVKYQALLQHGRTVLVSMDSGSTYAAVAAGKRDAAILSFLTSVNQAAVRYNLGSIYVSFQHEPDSVHHRKAGAPVQFLQAWDHIHQLAASHHLNWNDGGRLHWVLILIHNTYASWRAGEFWPGASEVDLIAADGYNSYGCGSGGQHQQQTPTDTFGPVVQFAAAHGGLPVFLAEWGSDDIPAGEQATYINQMQSLVASNKLIVGAMYWDTHSGHCDYMVDGSPASISALAAMGTSAALQGHV